MSYYIASWGVLAQENMRNSGISDDIINSKTPIFFVYLGIGDGLCINHVNNIKGGIFSGKFSNVFGKRMGLFLIMIVGVSTVIITFFVTTFVR